MNAMIEKLRNEINSLGKKIDRRVKIMEVCGTHTVAIFKHGIRELLPKNIKLISGPGCPVCVTSVGDVERAMEVSLQSDVVFTTFGDMLRVPGVKKSLSDVKGEGADVRVVYSPMDALKLAVEQKSKKEGKREPKKVVFFAAGFETTSPLIAATLDIAEKEKIENFYILSVHKLVPPALDALLAGGEVEVDGFMLPGHVSTIIGSRPYGFIPQRYKKCGVITGFDAIDILQGIYMLLHMIVNRTFSIEIQYSRAVREEGNPKAVSLMEQFFEPVDTTWRGIGVIKASGLGLKESKKHRDINTCYDFKQTVFEVPSACSCGDILKGIKEPFDCVMFGKKCTPENPVGPCMVSMEGSCSAYYKYIGMNK